MKKAIATLMAVAVTLSFTTMAAAQVQSQDLSGGDVETQDLEENRETVNWAMIYGSVEETVSLTDEEVEVFSWDEAESAADGSAVLAVDTADETDLNTVDGDNNAEVQGVPEDGADSFENTFDFDAAESPEVLEENTAAAESETYAGDGNNLFVYANLDAEGDLTDPVWAGLVETGQMHDEGEEAQDYEVLVGQDENQFESSYDLYVELEDQ